MFVKMHTKHTHQFMLNSRRYSLKFTQQIHAQIHAGVGTKAAKAIKRKSGEMEAALAMFG